MSIVKNTYFAVLAMVVAATFLRPSEALLDDLTPPLPGFTPPTYAPCLAKPMICVNDYIKKIDITVAFNPTEPICCPEWKELIENDPKCFCDYIASLNATATAAATPGTGTTNTTQFDNYPKCDLGPSANNKNLCKGSNNAGRRIAMAGQVSGLMLVVAGLIFY